jgi:serine phosphatase RsbU (regulator of sigma subunit)
MGVCDAMQRIEPRPKPAVMNAPHRSKVAGFTSAISPQPQTSPPTPGISPGQAGAEGAASTVDASAGLEAGSAEDAAEMARTAEHFAAVQDRLAGWITDLTTLQELTEQLARAATLDDALRETLRAGATLVGATRGLLALEPTGGPGTERTIGLGLGRADLGQIETVPRSSSAYARILDGLPEGLPEGPQRQPGGTGAASGAGTDGAFGDEGRGTGNGTVTGTTAHLGTGMGTGLGGYAEQPPPYADITHPDIATDDTLDPRHREVAARLGYAASYATPLSTPTSPRIGAAVWLYDEPAQPTDRQRHLLGRYLSCATEHIARRLELTRAREDIAAVREGLLPSRLPRVPGVALAKRVRSGPSGGGDWYDALPLPEGALGLAVGGVTGSGPSAVAAMGRLRASLRAYAVMEGEDPVAVLSDLELLLRLTEPARSATALFAYVEPSVRRVLLAGAGHCPPLIVGPHRTEYVETTLSAPLGMLACWEAPSVELTLQAGETLLLYSDGLLHRTGEEMDRAFSKLHGAAASASPSTRADPEALLDHVLSQTLPGGRGERDDDPEDVVLLAARF